MTVEELNKGLDGLHKAVKSLDNALERFNKSTELKQIMLQRIIEDIEEQRKPEKDFWLKIINKDNKEDERCWIYTETDHIMYAQDLEC